MSLQRYRATLAVVFVVSVLGAWLGASHGDHSISKASAALFAIALIAVAIATNLRKPSGADPEVQALHHNTRLAALTYIWAAASLFAAYGLSDLYWQHGLQYAAATALIAAILFALVHYATPGSALRSPKAIRNAKVMNVVHGLAAAGAFVFLVTSGKLWADKPDWAANYIFFAGLVSLIVVCTLGAISTQRASAV